MRLLIALGLSTAFGASIIGPKLPLLVAALSLFVLAVFWVWNLVEERASK